MASNCRGRVISLDGFCPEKSADLAKKIKILKASVTNSKKHLKSFTHLVCETIEPSDKFYAACAQGAWIVSPQYVDDSFVLCRWLPEGDYQHSVRDERQSQDLVSASRQWRWRWEMFQERPFSNWTAAVLIDGEDRLLYRRILTLGGASVVSLSLPLDNDQDVSDLTYVFVSEEQGQAASHLQDFGLICVLPSLITDTITRVEVLDPFDYLLKVADSDENEDTVSGLTFSERDGALSPASFHSEGSQSSQYSCSQVEQDRAAPSVEATPSLITTFSQRDVESKASSSCDVPTSWSPKPVDSCGPETRDTKSASILMVAQLAKENINEVRNSGQLSSKTKLCDSRSVHSSQLDLSECLEVEETSISLKGENFCRNYKKLKPQIQAMDPNQPISPQQRESRDKQKRKEDMIYASSLAATSKKARITAPRGAESLSCESLSHQQDNMVSNQKDDLIPSVGTSLSPVPASVLPKSINQHCLSGRKGNLLCSGGKPDPASTVAHQTYQTVSQDRADPASTVAHQTVSQDGADPASTVAYQTVSQDGADPASNVAHQTVSQDGADPASNVAHETHETHQMSSQDGVSRTMVISKPEARKTWVAKDEGGGAGGTTNSKPLLTLSQIPSLPASIHLHGDKTEPEAELSSKHTLTFSSQTPGPNRGASSCEISRKKTPKYLTSTPQRHPTETAVSSSTGQTGTLLGHAEKSGGRRRAVSKVDQSVDSGRSQTRNGKSALEKKGVFCSSWPGTKAASSRSSTHASPGVKKTLKEARDSLSLSQNSASAKKTVQTRLQSFGFSSSPSKGSPLTSQERLEPKLSSSPSSSRNLARAGQEPGMTFDPLRRSPGVMVGALSVSNTRDAPIVISDDEDELPEVKLFSDEDNKRELGAGPEVKLFSDEDNKRGVGAGPEVKLFSDEDNKRGLGAGPEVKLFSDEDNKRGLFSDEDNKRELGAGSGGKSEMSTSDFLTQDQQPYVEDQTEKLSLASPKVQGTLPPMGEVSLSPKQEEIFSADNIPTLEENQSFSLASCLASKVRKSLMAAFDNLAEISEAMNSLEGISHAERAGHFTPESSDYGSNKSASKQTLLAELANDDLDVKPSPRSRSGPDCHVSLDTGQLERDLWKDPGDKSESRTGERAIGFQESTACRDDKSRTEHSVAEAAAGGNPVNTLNFQSAVQNVEGETPLRQERMPFDCDEDQVENLKSEYVENDGACVNPMSELGEIGPSPDTARDSAVKDRPASGPGCVGREREEAVCETRLRKCVPELYGQWMQAASELGLNASAIFHGRPTRKLLPTSLLLSQLVALAQEEGARMEEDVSREACTYLQGWLQLHPPCNTNTAKIFAEALQLGADADPDFFMDLIKKCAELSQVTSSFACSRALLKFLVGVLEVNLNSSVQLGEKKLLQKSLVVMWLWKSPHRVGHTRPTCELVKLLERTVQSLWPSVAVRRHQVDLSACEALCTVVGLAGECIRLASTSWDPTWTWKCVTSDSVMFIARDISRAFMNSAKDDCELLQLLLNLLKPSWLRAVVTAGILSSLSTDYLLSEPIQVQHLSLHAIVSQYFFLVPSESTGRKSPRKRSQDRSVCDISDRTEREPPMNSAPAVNGRVAASQKNRLTKRNHKGETQLHTACIKNNFNLLEELLSLPGVDVNVRDNVGWTPLHEACNHGSLRCVQLLLEHVPGPGAFRQRGSPGLHQTGTSTPRMLLNDNDNQVLRKADLNAEGDERITPLQDAVRMNHIQVCRLLLEYGGKRLLDARTSRGYSALDLATTVEMREVLQGFSVAAGDRDDDHPRRWSHSPQQDSVLPLDEQEEQGGVTPPNSLYAVLVGEKGRTVNPAHLSRFLTLLSTLLTAYCEATGLRRAPSTTPGLSASTQNSQPGDHAVLSNLNLHFTRLKGHVRKLSTKTDFEALVPQMDMLKAVCCSLTS